jgi:hypothetical protein
VSAENVSEIGSVAPLTVSTLFRPARLRNPWLSGLKATGAAAAIVAVDLLIRRYLSESASVLLPVMTFAAGIAHAQRFVGRDEPEPSDLDNAKTRFDRAAVELESVSISNRQPLPLAPAAIGQVRNSTDTNCEVISFPTAARTNVGVAYASKELGQYHLFTDILSKQMACVSDSSEEAANSILKNLTEIETRIAFWSASFNNRDRTSKSPKSLLRSKPK